MPFPLQSVSTLTGVYNQLCTYMPILSFLSSCILFYTTSVHITTHPLYTVNQSYLRALILLTWSKFHMLLLFDIICTTIYCITKYTVYYVYNKLNSHELSSIKDFTLQYTVCRLILIAGMVENNLREVFVWLVYFSMYGCMRAIMHIANERFITLNGTHTVNISMKQQCTRIKHLAYIITAVNIIITSMLYYQLYNTYNTFHLLLILTCENSICLIVSIKIILKYTIELTHIHSNELQHPSIIDNHNNDEQNSEDDQAESGSGMVEKNQSQFLIDTIFDCTRHLITFIHMSHIWIYCIGFTFSLIDLYFLFSSRAIIMQLYKRITSYIQYCTALKDIDTKYPDATTEQLQLANDTGESCAICREKMTSASKCLPCKHIFHTTCLRAWCEIKQSCPVCRAKLSVTSTNIRNIIRESNNQPVHDIDTDVLQAIQSMDIGTANTSVLNMQRQQQLMLDRYNRLGATRRNNATTNNNDNNAASINNSTTSSTNTSALDSTSTTTSVPSVQFGRAILGQSLFRLSTPLFLTQYLPQISFELVRAHASSPFMVTTTHSTIRPTDNTTTNNNNVSSTTTTTSHSAPTSSTIPSAPLDTWSMFTDINDAQYNTTQPDNTTQPESTTGSDTLLSDDTLLSVTTLRDSTTTSSDQARRLRLEAISRRLNNNNASSISA